MRLSSLLLAIVVLIGSMMIVAIELRNVMSGPMGPWSYVYLGVCGFLMCYSGHLVISGAHTLYKIESTIK